MAKKKKTKKNWIIVLLVALPVAALYYFWERLSSMFTRSGNPVVASLKTRYPEALPVLSSWISFDRRRGKRFEDSLKDHISWTHKNPTSKNPRNKYVRSINFNRNVALQHAKTLGLL